MPLNTELTINVATTLTGNTDLELVTAALAQGFKISLASGAGAGQASNVFTDVRTLASGASENLDINTGGLLNALGQPFSLTKIKGIILIADTGNTTDLTIGNVANGIATIFGAATQSFALQPGEMLAKMTPSAAGYVITPATGDLLKVANAAGAVANYSVIIIGA